MQNNKRKRPNDVYAMIIGSMKSGTTSFYEYAITHPEICPAVVKEPEFFSENQSHGFHCKRYSDLWEFDFKRHKIALEASTGYTKYPLELRVPEKIFNYGINPKLIYCVRNPFDRIRSQYEFVKNNPNWENHEVISLYTINFSNYYLQLEKYRAYFPKDNFLIIDFDDIETNPKKALDELYAFLNLSKRYYPDEYKILNKTSNIENFSSSPRVLSKLEKKIIYEALRTDMQYFGEEYNFDISKWGF